MNFHLKARFCRQTIKSLNNFDVTAGMILLEDLGSDKIIQDSPQFESTLFIQLVEHLWNSCVTNFSILVQIIYLS